MPEVSIIVPVYDVEAYLPRCINSILSQTFTNFELILIDDGSPDNCGKICDEYAKKDSRIHIIHKANGGVASARNAGLDFATGKYIAFCDSDDSWNNTLLENVCSCFKNHAVDCVAYGYNTIESNTVIRTKHFQPGFFSLCTHEEKLYFLSNIYEHGWEIWNRAFSRDVIERNQLRFITESRNYAEDMCFVLSYMLYSRGMVCIEDAYYNYYIRDNSIMHKNVNPMWINELNEVSFAFYQNFVNVFFAKKHRKQYPIFHFLIMYQQYRRHIGKGDYQQLYSYTQKISKFEWHQSKTKEIRCCKKELKKYFGTDFAYRIRLLSQYLTHGRWKRFLIKCGLYYRFVCRHHSNK